MSATTSRTARLGFLGAGWIGRMRMRSLLAGGVARALAVADPDAGATRAAAELAPEAEIVPGLTEMLRLDLDGIVIATPSAMHAEQAAAALERGLPVFCQKPLGRSAEETEQVIATARRSDRRLGVDLSYRHTAAAARMRQEIARGRIGRPYAMELVFHNAYGPDKPWFTDRRLAGGGCVIDLATHLIDLGLWLTGARSAAVCSALLRRAGRPLVPGDPAAVEDFATAALELGDVGVSARLACSWFLPAGRDCEIECTLIGEDAALSLRNVNGSFYDLRLEQRVGTATEVLVEPPDDWGGRALAHWVSELQAGRTGFDQAAAAEQLALAQTIDGVYAAGGRP